MKTNHYNIATPSLANETWTSVRASTKGLAKSLTLTNINSTYSVRVALQTATPTLSTEGFLMLPYSFVSFDFDESYDGPVWAYQASGGALAPLEIVEGY